MSGKGERANLNLNPNPKRISHPIPDSNSTPLTNLLLFVVKVKERVDVETERVRLSPLRLVCSSLLVVLDDTWRMDAMRSASVLVPQCTSVPSSSTSVLKFLNLPVTLPVITRRAELFPVTFNWPSETMRNSTSFLEMSPLPAVVCSPTFTQSFCPRAARSRMIKCFMQLRGWSGSRGKQLAFLNAPYWEDLARPPILELLLLLFTMVLFVRLESIAYGWVTTSWASYWMIILNGLECAAYIVWWISNCMCVCGDKSAFYTSFNCLFLWLS